MELKLSVNFYLKSIKKDGVTVVKNVPILARVSVDGQMLNMTTGLKCEHTRQWSTIQQRFKSSAANANANNRLLDKIVSDIEAIHKEGKLAGDFITPAYIRERYRGEAKVGFFEVYDQFVSVESRSAGWAPATLAKFKTLRIHLVNMQATGVPMEFGAICHSWYGKVFEYFLGIGHSNGTAKKNIKLMNWFFTYCIRNKAIKIRDVGTFTVKDKAAEHRTGETIVFLRPEEFLKLVEARIVNDTLDRTRDLFVFLCATGLRVSDLQRLRSHHIQDGEIKIDTQKTGTGVTIPLNPFSAAILDKYKDWPFLKDGHLLPEMHPVNINKYLKQLGQVLGLDRIITTAATSKGELIKKDKPLHELLTCHCGRRTFVSLSIALNVNTSVLKRFTGHRTDAMLQHYTGTTEDQGRREMENFTPERLMKIS